jgi:hypothetical protein
VGGSGGNGRAEAWPATGLALGAGLGLVAGLLVGGGAGIAAGLIAGAAGGLVAGSAARALRSRR